MQPDSSQQQKTYVACQRQTLHFRFSIVCINDKQCSNLNAPQIRTCLTTMADGGCRQYVLILTANRSKCGKIRKKRKQKPHNRTETFNWLHTFALMFHRTRISWHDISSRWTQEHKTHIIREKEGTRSASSRARKVSEPDWRIEFACEPNIWINISEICFWSHHRHYRRSMTLSIFISPSLAVQCASAAWQSVNNSAKGDIVNIDNMTIN